MMKPVCTSSGATMPRRLTRRTETILAVSALYAVLFSTSAFSQVSKPIVSCESLAKLALPDTTITMAQTVAVGDFKMPTQNVGGPAGQAGQAGPGGQATQDAPGGATNRPAAGGNSGELQLPAYASQNGPFSNALQLYKYAVHQDANWDWKTADFFADIALGHKMLDSILNVGPNFKPFFDRGGKLMIYIGWTDYHNPVHTIEYYKSVLKESGGSKVANSIRLFNIPGMDHCSGGKGCDTFDKIAPIMQWVETGKAPDQLLATKVADGKIIRSSPLCTYPKVATYKGTGDSDACRSHEGRSSRADGNDSR